MNALSAVFLHELRRSVTAGRIIWWFLMAGFPVMITLILKSINEFGRGLQQQEVDTIWCMLLYALIPSVGCSLTVLLMAAPAVATELEQRTWVYLATRPNGIFWLLIGKYLVATLWGTSCAWVAACVSVTLAGTGIPLQLVLTLMGLSFLSALAYSAVYLLIGTLLPKRAMVLAVMYTIFVEVVLGFIPAVVNRLTVQYRLRSLLVAWVPTDPAFQKHPAFAYVFGEGSTVFHIFWLMALSAVFLSAGLVLAHRKEFTTASEGDL